MVLKNRLAEAEEESRKTWMQYQAAETRVANLKKSGSDTQHESPTTGASNMKQKSRLVKDVTFDEFCVLLYRLELSRYIPSFAQVMSQLHMLHPCTLDALSLLELLAEWHEP